MRFNVVLASVLLALAVTAASVQAQPKPIKVGILTELSGSLGTTGTNERDGFPLYLKKTGGKLGGHPVQTVIEDTASDPATAISKVQKLVESDNVDVLLGPIGSATGAAIKPYVTSHKIPTLLGATVDEIGDGKYIFRVTFPAAAEGFLEGYLAGRAGYKNAVLIAPNYNAGQSAIENFEKGFVAAGGRVVQKLMPRLGTADFGPFINQFPANADVVIAFEPGADGVRFIRQYGDFGKKLPLFGFPSTVDENTLPAEGKAADGFIGAAFYFSTLATQQNQTFVKDWEAAYHTAPGWQAAAGYIAAQILDQAFRSLADPSDKEALVKTIKGVKIVSPAGPLHFDSNNNPIAPRYIMQIRDVNGAEQPVVFATIPLFVPDASAPPLPKNIAFPKAGSASR